MSDASEPEVGSLTEETARLLGALAGWAKDQEFGEQFSDISAGARHEARECRYCPLCRAVDAVKHVNPEVKAHLSVALLSLARAAEALVHTPEPEPQGDSGRVQHIDLDADPGSDASE